MGDKKKDYGSYLFLGIAISFLVVAIIQMRATAMLPISIYIAVAWVSLELTILELLKTFFQYIKALQIQKNDILQKQIDLCERHITAFGKNLQLKEEVEKYYIFYNKLLNEKEKISSNKSI